MITKKKIFISGAGGMLGHALYHGFKNDYDLLCIDKIKNEKWIKKFNFNNKNYLKKVAKYKPHYLFHIGALTDLEYCEKNTFEADETNYKSVKVAVKICNKFNIPLIFISTAGIFDGKKIQYSEFDIPKPISVYAKTKHKAEKYIKKKLEKIFDYSTWLDDGWRKDKR